MQTKQQLNPADEAAYELIFQTAATNGATAENLATLTACKGNVSLEVIRNIAASFGANRGSKPLGLVMTTYIRKKDSSRGKKGTEGHSIELQGPWYPYPSFNRAKLEGMIKMVENGTAAKLLADHPTFQ